MDNKIVVSLTAEDIIWCDKSVERIKNQGSKSRKQSTRSEYQTSMEGARCELAIAKYLCKNVEEYKALAMSTTGCNTGKDFPVELTGLKKPVEGKFTAIKTKKTGFLFLRTPVQAGRGAPFDEDKHIPDSYFFLAHSLREDLKDFEMLGWIDSASLREFGKHNPVPWKSGMLQTFGIHWSELFPPETIKALDS